METKASQRSQIAPPAPARLAPNSKTTSSPANLTSSSPSLPTQSLSPPPQFTEWRRSSRSSQLQSQQVSNYDHVDPERGSRIPFRRGYSWYTIDEDDLKYNEDTDVIRTYALRILMYLGGPVFFVNLLGALWTLISIPLICIIHPLLLLSCSKQPKLLRDRIICALEPFIYINLFSIFSSARTRTHDAYSTRGILTVALLSPFMSIGITLAAWTAGCFWMFTVLVGDPQGTAEQEKRSSSLQDKDRNDGRDSVMWCRSVWRDWMVRCLI